MDDLANDTISAFVEGASDAAFAVDSRLGVVAWNRGACELLGYQVEEVVGRDCSDVVQAVYSNGDPLCAPGCGGGCCFRQSEPFEARACMALRRDGQWIAVDFSSVVIPRGVQDSLHSDAIAVVYVRPLEKQNNNVLTDRILRIFAFGHFGLIAGGKDLSTEHWERKQSLTILKVLAAHPGRAVPRDVLIDCLWPEVGETSGRKRLKATVYSLRQQLRAAGLGGQVVETANEAYLLRREAIWVDTEAFEKFNAEGDTRLREERWDEALKCYEEAEHLYRGEYLEEDIHAEWCAEERERFSQIHMDMLVNVALCHERRAEYDKAATAYRKILECDSCRESTHRALMECLVRLGQADSAITQYRQCRDILAHELDVEPMPETELLYRRILARDVRISRQVS